MENQNNLCGCRPEKLASRTIKQNLEECGVCGILKSCPYPKFVALKLVKSAAEEETNQHNKQTIDLGQIARSSMFFSDFHERASQSEDE